MEPGGSVETAVPIDVAGLGERDGAVVAVIDDFGRTLVGAGFDEVDAEAAFRADDAGRVDIEAAHLCDEGVDDGVIRRKNGDVAGASAVACDGDGDISLTAAEGGDELGRLQKTFKARRGHAD